MKRLLILCSVIILISTFGYGQSFTTVNGTTITDGGGQVWSNMTVVANLIPPNGSSLGLLRNQGFAIGDTPQYVLGDGSGNFSITLDDNTKITPGGSFWRLSLCSNTSSICSTLDIPISGASMNITSQVQAAIRTPATNTSTTITRGYNVNEVTGGNGSLFWRTTDNTLWGCQTTPNSSCPPGWVQVGSVGNPLPSASAKGQIIVSTGPGQVYTAQNWPTINIQNVTGVDCTGAVDSSTALNTLFASINQRVIMWPQDCQIRVDHQLIIQSQSAFVLLGLGTRPGVIGYGGPSIFGCNGAVGPILYINRSGYATIQGLGIYAKGNGCASSFTGSIQIDSTGNPGVTTHDFILNQLALTTSPQGTAIPGYIGVNITDGGKQNGEQIKVNDSWINCQFSSNSVGILNANGTSDEDKAEDNSISSCRYGIQNSGNIRIIHNLLTSNGINSVFGPYGANIYLSGCSSGQMNIFWNEEDSGGPFIDNDHAGITSCISGFNVMGNHIGASDVASGEYIIDVGNSGSAGWQIIGNTFLITTNTNQFIMGNNIAAPGHGPLAAVMDMGNNLRAPTGSNTLGFSDSNSPFQYGEYHFGYNFLNVAGPDNSPTSASSQSHIWFPVRATGASFRAQSPFLGLRSFSNSGNVFDDWFFQSISSTNTDSKSAITFNHVAGGATNLWFNWDGYNSGINISQLVTPSPPTGVTPFGTGGATTYTYALTGTGQTGTTAGSTTLSTAIGNPTLNTTNFNRIQWIVSSSIGVNGWCIWRIVGGLTQGKIKCVPAVGMVTNSQNGDQYYFDDTGYVADGNPLPTLNSTGMLNMGITPYLFANLPTVANGMEVFCSDCKNNADDGVAWDSAAVGAGHGCLVLRENNAWRVR